MSDILPLTPEEKLLTELVRQALGDRVDRPFEPFAVYDQQLDRIWVCVRDCSTTEKWFKAMCIYEANYPEKDEEPIVGFSIECAGALVKYAGLDQPVDLTRLLELVEVLYPNLTDQVVIARKLLTQLKTTIVQI